MMELLLKFADLFLHLDKHLSVIIESYGTGTYIILFLVVFCETGLVITPFLPGDSLLFAAGTFAGLGVLNPFSLFVTLSIAAIVGDTLNYWVGTIAGDKVFHENSRWFKKEYLERTERFYQRHGAKTIVLARFVPIVRTFAPFVAGVGRMNYGKFLAYNIGGGVLWTSLFIFAGYFFGNMPLVRKNFSLVILAIIILSVVPMVLELLRARKEKTNS